jgi:hypothetical protein
MFAHMAANSSDFLGFNSTNCYLYDSDLNARQNQQLAKLQTNVLESTVDLEMSETCVFVLTDACILKIFDVNSFDPIMNIEVKANEIKLAGTDFIVLFNSRSEMMYVYEQGCFYTLREEFNLNLGGATAGLFMLARDKTKFISLYNQNHLKMFNFI